MLYDFLGTDYLISFSARITVPFLPEYILLLSELNSYFTSKDNDSIDNTL